MSFRPFLIDAFRCAVAAVEAARATERATPSLELGATPVLVLALGKAAPGMARGFCAAHPGPVRGLVVAAEPEPIPPSLDLMIGDHPVPSARSLAAGEALLRAASSARRDETVVALISGGGSALAEALVPGVDLEDLRTQTAALLLSGRPIDDLNAVRTAVSRLKGGGLAAAAGGHRVVTLAISDVIGDRPEVIASGPTVASDASERAMKVVAGVGAIPKAIQTAVGRGAVNARSSGRSFTVVASRHDAAGAAAAHLRSGAWAVSVVAEPISGEAARLAPRLVAAAHPDTATVYSGETTVTVRGSGRGGRNQEAALAAALAIDGNEDAGFLAAGTDGIDGMTDAAGAVVDGGTAAEGRAAGLDPAAMLADNDSGRFFEQVSGRLVTDRTGTNVGDIWIVARR
jgi:hydroxypyruvate reductase